MQTQVVVGGGGGVMVAHLAVRDVSSDQSRQTSTFTGTCTESIHQAGIALGSAPCHMAARLKGYEKVTREGWSLS